MKNQGKAWAGLGIGAGLMFLSLALAAAAGDFYSVSGVDPELARYDRFRDLNFAKDEFSDSGGMSVAQPNDESCCVFSPDGRWVWVQTKKLASPQQGGGTMAHLHKFEAATGKKLGEIPVDLRWPGNPLAAAMKQQGVSKIEIADLLAASDRQLAALMRVGYAPKRWVPVLYDAASGKLAKALGKITGSGNSNAFDMSFSAAGRYLLVSHDAPATLHVFELASGRQRRIELSALLAAAGLAGGSRLYPLPGEQMACFAHLADDEAEKRVVVLDLASGRLAGVLGEHIEMDLHMHKRGAIEAGGQVLVGPARVKGDESNANNCAGGSPCLGMYKFPEMEEMLRFRVKTDQGSPITEYFGISSWRMALSEADPRLLLVGSNSYAKTDYAMLLDTTGSGEIQDWVRLPVRHDHWMKLGKRAEGGYWILAEQPAPGTGLRLFAF